MGKCIVLVMFISLFVSSARAMQSADSLMGKEPTLPVGDTSEFRSSMQVQDNTCASGTTWKGEDQGCVSNAGGAGAKTCNEKCIEEGNSTPGECAAACNKSGDKDKKVTNDKDPSSGSPHSDAEEMAQRCIAQSQAAISSCSSNANSATHTCDTNNNSSLTGAASQVALATGQTTASSVQAACSNMGGVSQAGSAGLAAYRTQCGNAKTSCTNSCAAAKNAMDQCANSSGDSSAVKAALQSKGEYQQVSSNNSACVALQTKLDQAGQAVQNYTQTAANSANCAAATAANDPSNDASQANNPNSAYCKAHPNVASCVLDCSKSEMASNPTCMYLKNPTANSGMQKVTDGISGVGGGASTAASSASSAAGLNLGDGGGYNPSIDPPGPRQAGQQVGGKQGGGANIGGPGGGGGPMGGASRAGAPVHDNTVVLGSSGGGGFYGGSGGGGAGGAFAASNANNGGGSGYRGVYNGTQRNPNAPDLRKFLPGGQLDPRRGVAGMSGPDGITGPNSDLWQKVQLRYRMNSTTLLP